MDSQSDFVLEISRKRRVQRSSIGVQSEFNRSSIGRDAGAQPLNSIGNRWTTDQGGVQSESNWSPIRVHKLCARVVKKLSVPRWAGLCFSACSLAQTMCVSCQETLCRPMGRFVFFCIFLGTSYVRELSRNFVPRCNPLRPRSHVARALPFS